MREGEREEGPGEEKKRAREKSINEEVNESDRDTQ